VQVGFQGPTNSSGGAGNVIDIKSGTYTITTAVNTAGSSHVTVIGFGSTPGDGGTAPIITTSTNSVDIVHFNTGGAANWNFQNIVFQSTAGTPGSGIVASGGQETGLFVSGCKFTGLTIGIYGNDDANTFIINNVVLFHNEFVSNKQALVISGPGIVWNNYIHSNTGTAITNLSAAPSGGAGSQIAPLSIIRNIFDSNNVGLGANNGTWSYWAEGNVFYNQTSDGINIPSVAGLVLELGIQNNIFYGNGGYGVNIVGAQGNPAVNQYNSYGSNTSGARNNFSAGPGDVTLTGNPFTNAGSKDFSLNNTAGAGAALRGAGFPGVLGVGSSSTGALDIGPIQHSASGSGGQKGFPIVQ